MQPTASDDPLPSLPETFAPTTSLSPLWEPTRAYSPATQLAQDANDYLGGARRDIGRAVGDNLRELFVSCDPAPAMLQQFELLHPEFVAVHDIGTASSRRLLGAVAAAGKRTMQKLVIRRQGHGTPLATLEFVEFEDAQGAPLRLYSTETDADTASRHALARVLLAHSRLAVIMVGDMPSHALAQALQPMQGDIAGGQWKNGHLLLLPLASPAALASLGSQLGRGGGRRDSTRGSNVTVRTTPQIASPAEAWNFISATWNRLREQLAAQGVALAGLPGASGAVPAVPAAASPSMAPMPTAPLMPPSPPSMPMLHAAAPAFAPLQMPALPPAASSLPPPGSLPPFADTSDFPRLSSIGSVSFAQTSIASLAEEGDPLHRYVKKLTQINGVLAACVFDAAGGYAAAHAGTHYRGADLAREGAALLAALKAAGQHLLSPEPTAHAGKRAGDPRLAADLLPEAAVTLAQHHLLLRPLPARPGLVLHAVLDKTQANLTLARLQIARQDSVLDGSADDDE